MNLDNLFETIDGLVGHVATFQGLTFALDHGIVIIDYVLDFEFEGEVVEGYLLGFLPFLEIESPFYDFALDLEGLKYLISEYVLV